MFSVEGLNGRGCFELNLEGEKLERWGKNYRQSFKVGTEVRMSNR